jgi:outer membrane protein TolC
MKNLFAICLFCLSLNSSYAVLVNFDNLSTLIEKNSELQELKVGSKELEQRPSRLSTSFAPEVEVSAGFETFDKPDVVQATQPHFGLRASMNLYRGGTDSLRDKKQKLELESYEAERKVIKKEIIVASYKALANLLRYKEGHTIYKKMKVRIQKQVQRNKRNVELGQDTGTDLLHFEIKLQEVDLALSEIELKEEKYFEQLKSYLPKQLHDNLRTPSVLMHQHEWDENYTIQNLDEAIYTKERELETKESELDWKISEKKGFPEVNLYAAWAQETQLHEEEFDQAKQRSHKVIGVNFKLPLSILFTKQDEVQTKKSHLRRQRVYEELNKRKVKNQLRSEFRRLKNLHVKLHQYEKMAKTAESYTQKVEKEYERGVKSSTDVINSYEQLAQMKIKFKDNQAQFMSLLAELFI